MRIISIRHGASVQTTLPQSDSAETQVRDLKRQSSLHRVGLEDTHEGSVEERLSVPRPSGLTSGGTIRDTRQESSVAHNWIRWRRDGHQLNGYRCIYRKKFRLVQPSKNQTSTLV